MQQDRHDEEFRTVLAKLAPGTTLRDGVQRVIASHRGALIVIGMSEDVLNALSNQISTEILTQMTQGELPSKLEVGFEDDFTFEFSE